MTVVQPGLLILHGNRLELLKQAVFEWTGRHPLAPLESEVFLVQSNGVAEWLKMALATRHGICAAIRVELPARFLWRSYRQVLGAAAVPQRSATDKTALTWRLLQLLPSQLSQPEFAPLGRFLASGDWERRLQLAQRLADLFDQYLVYRADWLAAWAGGATGLPRPDGRTMEALPADQQWQPLLWQALVASIGPEALLTSRPALHRRFMEALASDDGQLPVPRRIVLFGLSSVPQQTLEALVALSGRCQVLLAVANPCRYHWADIIDGRELLRAAVKRHGYRAGRDLSAVPLEDMHGHAHPLLAAWGRQGRDFVRQLDAHDDAAATWRAPLPRIDLFDDAPGDTLLTQMQARIRDLVPLSEHVAPLPKRPERSVAFHVAHNAQREVEILHDQLLGLLADPPGAPLAPRDIIVMVPDIALFAPSIGAVFGQYGRHDPRHIPFNVADLRQRTTNPLLVALEWLLRLPHQRCTLSELQSLLDVPAIAARFGVDADDLPQLGRWMAGSGIRWGLHAEHRAELGLDACGDQNSWRFGLHRLLLGYASGPEGDFAGIEPYAEVGGLEATLVGSLASLIGAVERWATLARTDATPSVWAQRLDDLLAACFAPTDDTEQATLVSLLDAKREWLEAAEAAAFDESVPLSVVGEAWLSAVDEPTLSQRFLSGGVTFCTLLPMRAVPFEVVCLLGMNDGDYPRPTSRSDFDLMGLSGQRRPGDRSRRDDDRYLMLEAVLSARQVLYVSWTGRSVRDNSEQQPSVLVSQLRDYLGAGWGPELVGALTTEHPLQAFSRRYFEQAGFPVTYAREWRQAHAGRDAPTSASTSASAPAPEAAGNHASSEGTVLKVLQLARFLRNPVKAFFRHRLEVVFDELPDPVDDDEVFAVGGLDAWRLVDELTGRLPSDDTDATWLDVRRQRLVRAGRLQIGALGRRESDALVATVTPMVQQWREWCTRYDLDLGSQPLRLARPGAVLDDRLEGVRSSSKASGSIALLTLKASNLLNRQSAAAAGTVRGEMLIEPWVRSLAASLCGQPTETVVVGRDAVVQLQPLPPDAAGAAWDSLIDAWQAGMASPLPLACKTALGFLQDPHDARSIYQGKEPGMGEGSEACLARTYPDFVALSADGRFAQWAPRLYGPLQTWLQGATVVPLEQTALADAVELDDG